MDVLDFCFMQAGSQSAAKKANARESILKAREGVARRKRKGDKAKAVRRDARPVFGRKRAGGKTGGLIASIASIDGLTKTHWTIMQVMRPGVWYKGRELSEASGYDRCTIPRVVADCVAAGYMQEVKNAGEYRINKGLVVPYGLYALSDKAVGILSVLFEDWEDE